jgi:tRNA-dihydrouridine synthase
MERLEVPCLRPGAVPTLTRPLPQIADLVDQPERLHALLAFDPVQQPIGVQLGGRDVADMETAARVCTAMGYREINISKNFNNPYNPNNPTNLTTLIALITLITLDCGCPSATVASVNAFGAALMKEAKVVQELAAAVRRGAKDGVEVTVKHRLGNASNRNNP